VIGGNLVSLEITSFGVNQASKEVLELIPKHCVNLQYLEIGVCVVGEECGVALRGGLVKLAKLVVNGASVRLGTEWDGIDERE
jgi:hypothetical protein